jgi:hypothetical protein
MVTTDNARPNRITVKFTLRFAPPSKASLTTASTKDFAPYYRQW